MPPTQPGDGMFPPQSPPIVPPQSPPDSELSKAIAALDARINALEEREPIPGPRGPPGQDGANGRNADNEAILAALIAYVEANKDRFRGPPGEPGTTAKQLPIYIGAKDANGKITMPLTPLYPGDGAFIHVKPPSLKDAGNN